MSVTLVNRATMTSTLSSSRLSACSSSSVHQLCAPRFGHRRSSPCIVSATDPDNPFATPSATQRKPDDTTEEQRLEAIEANLKRAKKASSSGSSASPPRKQIPIRGSTNAPKAEEESNMAPWKEGQLFPEGWEQMGWGQRVTELYMGRRGILFWANKAAFASVFVVLGGWIIFRFVGPNLGLYTLPGDL